MNNDNDWLTVSVDLYILDSKYYKYNTQKAFASIKLSVVLHIERQSDTKCLSESQIWTDFLMQEVLLK